MYTTHGDMIIFRPNHLEHVVRTPRSARYRDGWADRSVDRRDGSRGWEGPGDEHRPERAGRGWDGRTAGTEALRERIAELEARVSRLEARLQRLGEAPPERLYDPEVSRAPAPERRPPRRRRDAGPAEAPQVRVSLQADGGAQVSLGEVRMITEE